MREFATGAQSAGTARRLSAHATKGKLVEYMTQYDHNGVKGKLTTLTCGEAALPKCSAIDVKTKKTIAEVAQQSSTRCASLLAREVKHERCSKRTRGKKIEYKARFEQRGAKPKRVALVCK
jgi:hypothetical protein